VRLFLNNNKKDLLLDVQSQEQQRHSQYHLCTSHWSNLVKTQTLPVTSHSKHLQLYLPLRRTCK
jgi:hypothetical protein